jgi:hypothetical protein
MEEVTGEPAKMWGDAIVGFGKYYYEYKSGRKGNHFLVGFSPRKQNLTLYITGGFDTFEALCAQLGKHKKTGGACFYVNKLADLNPGVLRDLVSQSVEHRRRANPTTAG